VPQLGRCQPSLWSVNPDGRRTRRYPSAILGPRPLAGALCQSLLAATGITNKSLGALMTGLLGTAYTMNPGQLPYRR
jgi:hypothetical protein